MIFIKNVFLIGISSKNGLFLEIIKNSKIIFSLFGLKDNYVLIYHDRPLYDKRPIQSWKLPPPKPKSHSCGICKKMPETFVWFQVKSAIRSSAKLSTFILCNPTHTHTPAGLYRLPQCPFVPFPTDPCFLALPCWLQQPSVSRILSLLLLLLCPFRVFFCLDFWEIKKVSKKMEKILWKWLQ